MLEPIILGIIQGVSEWLPVSSEGLIVLTMVAFFEGADRGIDALISQALFLHMGTLFAALVYFRKDIAKLIHTLIRYRATDRGSKNILVFLVVATVISGTIGIIFLAALTSIEEHMDLGGSIVMAGIGILLLITGLLQLAKKSGGVRSEDEITLRDGIILGIAQGFAALPGISRSGTTVAFLLLRKINDESALRLSFLMSIPIVLAGNIVLNVKTFSPTIENILALCMAFIFGLLTIGALLKLARAVNFGWFVLIFGILTILAAFI